MVNSILKWAATLLTISGAIAVSLGIDPLNIYLLNAGSVLWTIWGVRIRERSIIVVNLSLLSIYIYGIFARI